MPIVIKEIHVITTVERKAAAQEEISESLYARLKEDIMEELLANIEQVNTEKTKRER